MITPNIPIQNVPDTNIQMMQQGLSPVDENVLHRNGVMQHIKTFVLRYLTQRKIGQNEELHIATGVSLINLKTNQSLLIHNENQEHFAASVNKLPITLLVQEELRSGEITLDTELTWQESDRRAGAGMYDAPGSPLKATVGEVITDLLTRSGNTAARILVNGVLHGPIAANERLELIPELAHTRLIPVDPTRFYMGNTTAKESLFVLQKLIEGKDQYSNFIKNALVNNIFTDIGVKSQLAGNDFIVLVNKIGQLNDPDGNNRHDVGIIYNTKTKQSYGFAYLTTSPSSSDIATPQAEQSLKDMGRYYLKYAGDWRQGELPIPFSAKSQTAEGKILY